MSFVVGVLRDGDFFMGDSYLRSSMYDVSEEVSYWDIGMGWVIGIVVEDMDLGIGCISFLTAYL